MRIEYTIKSGRSSIITAIRGLVAISVVLHHASGLFESQNYWHVKLFKGILDFPYGRVEFFFVASGIVIAMNHFDDIGNRHRLAAFIRKRVVSIYPLYLLIGGFVLVIGLLPGGFRVGNYPDMDTIIASALLTGSDSHRTVLTVAWTLYHEMLFYILFAIAIAHRCAGYAVTCCAVLLALVPLIGGRVDALPDYVLSPLNLLFLFGVVVGAWAGHARAATPRLLMVLPLCILLWSVVTAQGVGGAAVQVLVGFGWAAALAAMLYAERRGAIAVPACLLRLGDASYALYLLHFPALALMGKVASATGWRDRWPAESEFGVVIVVIVAAALVVHQAIERPLRRWVSASLTRLTPPQSPRVAV